MTGFFEMLEENNIDFDILRMHLKSEEFLKEAGPVVDDGNDTYKVLDSEIDGKGIFANKNFNEGDFIGYAKVNDTRTLAGRYTNHSDFNNANFYYIKENNNSVLIAEKHIDVGQEILIDYRHHTHNKEYYE
jgi:SET domain-containing protein